MLNRLKRECVGVDHNWFTGIGLDSNYHKETAKRLFQISCNFLMLSLFNIGCIKAHFHRAHSGSTEVSSLDSANICLVFKQWHGSYG